MTSPNEIGSAANEIVKNSDLLSNKEVNHLIRYLQSESFWTHLISKGIDLVLVFVLFTLTYRFIIWLTDRYFTKASTPDRYSARKKTLHGIINSIYKFFYYFLLIYSAFSILGVPVSTLVAGVGMLSIALGIGAKDLVSDCIAGFFILLEDQYRIGDLVTINQISGTIRKFSVRTTVIKDYDGAYHYLSNGDISTVANFSKDEARIQLDFFVNGDSPFEAMNQLAHQVYEDLFLEDKRVIKRFVQPGLFTDGSNRTYYRIQLWVRDYDDLVSVQGQYRRALVEAFHQAGIVLPVNNPTDYQVQTGHAAD